LNHTPANFYPAKRIYIDDCLGKKIDKKTVKIVEAIWNTQQTGGSTRTLLMGPFLTGGSIKTVFAVWSELGELLLDPSFKILEPLF